MADRTLDDQLVKYLTDVHSIEEQALAQLRSAPDIAGEPMLEQAFREHLAETMEHEHRVRERLETRGGKPNKLKDTAGAVTGKGFVLFARAQPDTPGKLAAHAFSYEHLELAAYELLTRLASRAGDEETVAVAQANRAEEDAMARRLESGFERAVDASLSAKNVTARDLPSHLVKYLADAHAIEAQAIRLLEKGQGIVGDDELVRVFEDHLQETRHQQSLIETRLAAHDAKPSRIKDAALSLGALNWGAFFAAQPDTPAKLAGFAYAFEHLEIASYEELRIVARRDGDRVTVEVVDGILAQERAAAAQIASHWDRVVDASLEAVGAAA